jgi:serine/threonine protein kinase
LRREAQVLARLEHPGIVPVHEVGTLADGRVFYTMKLVRGERLDAALSRPVALAERLRMFLRIAEAVAFAHAQGILHRDLKPENVMVGAFGEVLVLDWGLAKVLDDPDAAPARRTGESAVLGTPGFMSPEQQAGASAAVDARTDVYSLGAMLRWLAGPEAAPPLEAIARKATAFDLAARYPDVATLSADVAHFLDGAAVSAYSESLFRRALRIARRHRVAVGIVVAYMAGRAAIWIATGR